LFFILAFILPNTIVPFCLYWFTLLTFNKFGGPQLNLRKKLVISIMGWVAFWIGEIVIIGFYPIDLYKNPLIFFLFFAAYTLVAIFPLKLVSKFSYVKTLILVVIFWNVQFLIQIGLSLTIFRPCINYIR
jgi:hypothetical protein